MDSYDMDDYDRAAWEELVRRREKFLSRRIRRLLPQAVRQRASESVHGAARAARELPGAGEAQRIVAGVLNGATEGVAQVALGSLSYDRLVERFAVSHRHVQVVTDIRDLSLHEIDQVRPRLSGKYMAGTGASGVGAGFVVSGGEFAALVGALGGGAVGVPAGGIGVAPGAGVGAAPGVATVVSALAADAAATTFAAMRLTFETAGYYGYDANRPDERLRAMGVLNVATAVDQATKNRAYLELKSLAGLIVRNATWKQLDENVVTRIVHQVFRRLTEKLTKRKLGNAIPVVGIAIGGGFNVLSLSRVGDAADMLYREQFLRDKYGLDGPSEFADIDVVVDAAASEDDLDVVEILEEELDAAGADEEFSLQFHPSEIATLVTRFSYADDSAGASAGAAAGRRGYYTREELVAVCTWKTARSKGLVAALPPHEIETATRRALANGTDERSRMEALAALGGIGVPTASALLHFASPEAYPILDKRALESLGVKGRSSYSVAFWLRYLDACRSLAATHGVSIRTLDKALWQHSKERPSDA